MKILKIDQRCFAKWNLGRGTDLRCFRSEHDGEDFHYDVIYRLWWRTGPCDEIEPIAHAA